MNPPLLRRCIVGALLTACGAMAHAADLTVSAAASLTNALSELGPAFEAQHPGTQVVCNFAASDDEIDLAQRYLAIEKLRFGDRLQVSWDLDPEASAAPLPPLVLQPLVENAVRHGIEPSLRGGRIQVRTRKVRGMAELLVTNSLSGEPGRRGSGMALANVAERLRLMHDVAASLETGIEGEHFRARIVVPL